jgi:hypothetical protein
MLAAVTAASHPAVAGLLGLGAAGLAAVVVAMAWNVHVRQIRLAEQLARRQFLVTSEAGAAGSAANGAGGAGPLVEEIEATNGMARASRVIIDGPDTVVTGEQARYRVRPSGNRKVVSWAAGGGSMAQSPDPAHPPRDEVHHRRAGRDHRHAALYAPAVPARVGAGGRGGGGHRVRGGPGRPG